MKQKVLNKLCLLLPLVAANLLMPQRMAAQTRIAVVSDPHVMATSLVDDADNEAWVADYANERKMLDKSNALFGKLVTTLKGMSADQKPQLLLITGDLTKDGENVSHTAVKTMLADLKTAGIQVYVIPGNHDINSKAYQYAVNAKTELADANKVTTTAQFSTFYAGYGYDDENSEYDDKSLSYVAEPIPGLVLLAIDSHSGSISEETLTWLCEKAGAATAAGKQVIAMMHHPLIEHITGATMFISTYTVADNTNVRNALINAGVKVILTGHFHTSDIAYDWNDDSDNGIYDVNTGSLISYPCDYRMLTLSQNMETLHVATASLESTADLIPEGAESWKVWLENRVKAVANKKFNSSPYNMMGLTDDEKTFLTETAAIAFSLHAEGDENENAASGTLLTNYAAYSGTSSFFATAKTLLTSTFSSMLTDKSNYEGAHENQTADRTLDINLPSLDEDVMLTVDGWASYCTGHDLDISQTDDVAAYIVTEVSDDKAILAEVSEVPAGQGFLLQGTASTEYTLKATSGVDPDNGNILQGTLVATDAPANCYVLSNSDPGTIETLGFYKFPLTPGTQIPANKAYLTTTVNGARMISIGGNVTGISTLKTTEKADQTIYTLQGTRAGKLGRGIYIQNGKKIIVK